ncbi:MAG TPA: FHA domain-containing protein [Bryobacteraceae bacterium]|nr:FHA domain-containing protein [Bryobacteraceae bacterium]
MDRVITVGRAPDNNKVLDFPMVSWRHARLLERGGSVWAEDLQSTNGLFVNSPDNRLRTGQLRREDVLYFGSYGVPVQRLLEPGQLVLGQHAAETSVGGTRPHLVIGRDPSADVVVDHPAVSWRHAQIENRQGAWAVSDLGSMAGTYVDGQRVAGTVPVSAGQEICVGHFRFTFDETGTLRKKDYRGNFTMEAIDVVVLTPKGRRLLNPVSFSVYPQELVALMGPAGAGKTTLMKALNGYSPLGAGQGRVLFNGMDLSTQFEQLRASLGYVPQDDIMHGQLTVREALYYTAKLRTDLRDDEIQRRIGTVLGSLKIEDIVDRQIGSPERKVLSGGQRKRVNIAMELMSDPDVIFLDEPTSGLSSHDAEQVVRLLRELADSGKTIIATIHQPSLDVYKLFDNLLMIARDKGDNPGQLAYYGKAFPQSIDFLNATEAKSARAANKDLSPEMLLRGLEHARSEEWARRYRESHACRQYVTERAGTSPQPGAAAGKRGTGWGLKQLIPLVRRNVTLKVRDRMQSVLMLAQAPLFAAMLAASFRPETATVFTSIDDWGQFSSRLGTIHFLMVVAVVWFGCNNAARDVVGEVTVYERERMVGLSLPSYVLSKLLVLGGLCALQCGVLLAIVYPSCGLAAPVGALFAVLWAASMVGAAIGLTISSTTKSTEAAIMLLPIVLLPMIIFGGGIKPVHEMKPMDKLAQVVPSRWAFEGVFLEESRKRKEIYIPRDCDRALNDQRNGCNEILAKLPGRFSLPEVKAEKSDRDVAERAFPAKGRRHSLQRVLTVLGTMGVLLLGLVLSVLRSRDVR